LIGDNREALLDERDRLVALPLLVRQDTGKVQHVGMIGYELENPAIDILGLGELLVLVEADRERHRLLEREIAHRCRLLLHMPSLPDAGPGPRDRQPLPAIRTDS
jgi:hypothetical protein